MNMYEHRPPVGLQPVLGAVDQVIHEAHIYRSCRFRPPHFLINLDAGSGQTTLTSFIAETYAKFGIEQFCGLELFLEYRLDGSLDQLHKVLREIRSSACYTNEYHGIIAMDISMLANHMGEKQVEEFLKEIPGVAENATIIFYVGSAMSQNKAALIRKIREVIENVELVSVQPYSSRSLAEIVLYMLEDAGVDVSENEEVLGMVTDLVCRGAEKNIATARQLCRKLVRCADFSGFVPRLGCGEIQTLLQQEGKNNEK